MGIAATSVEEGESDLPVLFASEVNPTVLLLHTLLCDLTIDDVRAGSAITSVGSVLHPRGHVVHEHPTSTEVVPVSDPVPPLREHHVRDEVSSYDIGVVPTELLVGVGGDQEVRAIIRSGSRGGDDEDKPGRQRATTEAEPSDFGVRSRCVEGAAKGLSSGGTSSSSLSGEESKEESALLERACTRMFAVDGRSTKLVDRAWTPFLLLAVPGNLLLGGGLGPDRGASELVASVHCQHSAPSKSRVIFTFTLLSRTNGAYTIVQPFAAAV